MIFDFDKHINDEIRREYEKPVNEEAKVRIPFVHEDSKGRKSVKSHLISYTDKKIYRELQFQNDLIPLSKLREKFAVTNSLFSNSVKRLTRLGYTTMLSVEGEDFIMAN